MYLFALATQGVIGLTALLYIFYSILKISLKRINSFKVQSLCGYIALMTAVHFLVAGLTESLLNIHVLTSSFALILGIGLRKSFIRQDSN
jgi:O-antigen ligase